MNLIKTSLLSFIATSIRMLSALVINKFVAVYIGPSGLALIGQFQNFTQMVMTVAQGGVNTGVVKYTAQYKGDDEKKALLFSTAIKISLICSVLTAVGVVVLSRYFSLKFLGADKYTYVFLIFGGTLVLFVLNSLLLSILNGLKEIGLFVSVNILQSIYSLIFTSVLIFYMGLEGALIALATNQSVVFVVVVFFLVKRNVVRLSDFRRRFETTEGKKLLKYSAMALTSAISVPVSHLLIRGHLVESISLESAGYWQGCWYISTMYLMLATTTLSVYYLPRLSEITDRHELRDELVNGYKIIIPIVMFVSLGVFVLKDFLISILFTKDFYPMRELFLFQLVGDVFKLASWLLSYLMLSRAMVKTFIVTELLFGATFVLFSIVLTNIFGLVGMSYSYALNYMLYFICMGFIFRGHIVHVK